MMKYNLKPLLPLVILLGLTLYLSEQVGAETTARDIPHAPDWDIAAPKLISDVSAPNVSDRPYIGAAPNGTKLLIVYNRMAQNNLKDPYFSRSTNNGQTWSAPAPIYLSLNSNSLEVNLTIGANGTGHAVWVEDDTKIMYSRETNWPNDGSPTLIDDAGIQASSPKIIASGTNTLDMIWTAANFTGPALTRVWHRRSTDDGDSWTAETPISPATSEALFADIAIDGNGNLHVVWEQTYVDGINQGSYIYYTRGAVSGSTINWSAPIRIGDVSDDPDGNGPITAHSRSARRMVIHAEGGRLHVAFTTHWQDHSQWVHYVACSSACTNVQNWSNDISVSGAVVGVNANSPKYIVSDIFSVRGCVHIYFHGIDDTLENNELILGVNSCDGWTAFGRDEVTQPQTQSLHTSVALTELYVHMVYEQTNNGGTTRQIYYRRGTPPPFTLALPFISK